MRTNKITYQNSHYLFCVKRANATNDNIHEEYHYIALINTKTKAIAETTDYATYVLYRRPKDMHFISHDKSSLYDVAQFLNYVFFYDKCNYHLKTVTDITIEMVSEYLSEYTKGKINGFVSESTVKKKRNSISWFLECLCNDKRIQMKHLHPGDLIEETVFYKDHKKMISTHFKLHVRYPDILREQSIYRDMPLAIIERFIKFTEMIDPELTLAIVLMAYGGLRIGEVCNLRQPDSCYGRSLRIQYGQPIYTIENGISMSTRKCNSIDIDLKATLELRSDGKYVGGIKRKRIQRVYGGFSDIIFEYYTKHLNRIREKATENTKPLFISKQIDKTTGKYMAATREALRERIKRIFYNFVLPSCERDANPDLQQYYYSMQDHTWGPHAFRHWFTVYLVVVCGVDEVTLQTLRGDRSRESSKKYLERKGIFLQSLISGSEDLGIQIYDPGEMEEL